MREIRWGLFFAEAAARSAWQRRGTLAKRVVDVAAVTCLATLMVGEWSIRRLGGEGDE